LKALKILLKEKDSRENQIQSELKILRDNVIKIESEKIGMDHEMALLKAKLHEATGDAERYLNYSRIIEEKLNESEKRRENFKIDAQETIQL
jgi:hypothetical protein